jgi:hypothetical protein
MERSAGERRRMGDAFASKDIVLSGEIAIGGYCRLSNRQAGGHWFEPSTAHLTKAPLGGVFCSSAKGRALL